MAQVSVAAVRVEPVPKPQPVKVSARQYGDLVVLSTMVQKSEGSEPRDSSESEEREATDAKKLFVFVPCSPPYDIELMEQGELDFCITFQVFKIVAYGDIPVSGDQALREKAIASLRAQFEGKPVNFGATILFEHYMSGKYLNIDNVAGKVFGTLKLNAIDAVQDSCVFTIKPANKYETQNTGVTYDSQVVFSCERLSMPSNLWAGQSADGKTTLLSSMHTSAWTLHPFDINRSNTKHVKTGTPCRLFAKNLGYYLGANEDSVECMDVSDSSTVWMLFNEDIHQGGFVQGQKRYYFMNLQALAFMDQDLILSRDLQGAGLFGLESLTTKDEPLPYNGEVRIATADGRVFGIDEDKDRAVSLTALYPAAGSFEDPDSFKPQRAKLDKLHKLQTFVIQPLEEPASQLMLLGGMGLILSIHSQVIPYLVTNLLEEASTSTELSKKNVVEAVELAMSTSEMLMNDFEKRSLTEKLVFAKLKIPSLFFAVADALLNSKKATKEFLADCKSQDIIDDLKELLRLVENAYQCACRGLIRMMKTDPKACTQLPTIEISRINDDPELMPTILELNKPKMTMSVPETFATWLKEMEPVSDSNVVEQKVVLTWLIRLLRECPAKELPQCAAVLREHSVSCREYRFAQSGESVFVSFLPESAFDGKPKVFNSLSALENLKPGVYPEFVANLLRFYDCCYTYLDENVANELFEVVGITPNILTKLFTSEQCALVVRAASMQFLVYFSRPPRRDPDFDKSLVFFAGEVKEFSRFFAGAKQDSKVSPQAALVLSALSLKNLGAKESLEDQLLFARDVLKFAKTVLNTRAEPLVFAGIIQRATMWALLALHDHKANSSWFYSCISAVNRSKNATIEQASNLNELVSELFELLKSALDCREEAYLKLLLYRCSINEWKVTEADLNAIEAELEVWSPSSQLAGNFRDWLALLPEPSLLPETVMYSLIASLKNSFELTEGHYQVLLRVFNSRSKVLQKLPEVVFATETSDSVAKLRRVVNMRPSEQELVNTLGSLENSDLNSAVSEQCALLQEKISILEDAALQKYAQSLSLREKTYRTYLELWKVTEHRLSAGESSDSLLKLSCALFAYFLAFIRGNADCRAAVLQRLSHPFSTSGFTPMEVTDIAALIRELGEFASLRTDQARTVFAYICKNYYGKSITHSGAFHWITAILTNSDGSLKSDMQATAFSALREVLEKISPDDDTGSTAMVLKQTSVCAIGNKSVQLQLQQELKASNLADLMDATKRADIAETALLFLSRVIVMRSAGERQASTEDIMRVLKIALEVAKGLFILKEEDVAEVIRLGLFEQVKARDRPNVLGWVLSKEQFNILTYLRLLSSGRSPDPLGGIAAAAGAVLKACDPEKKNGPKLAELTSGFAEYLREAQAFIARLKSRLQDACDFSLLENSVATALEEQVFTGKKEDKTKAFSAFLGKGEKEIPVPASTDPNFFSLKLLTIKTLTNIDLTTTPVENMKKVLSQVLERRYGSAPRTEAQFLAQFADITKLFSNLPSTRYLFPVLSALLNLFEAVTFTAEGYKQVFGFWVNTMMKSRYIRELTAGVEFYHNFGDHKSPIRYEVLLQTLGEDNIGSRLLAKIRKTLKIEIQIRETLDKGEGSSVMHLIRKMRLGRPVSGAEAKDLVSQHSELVRWYIRWLRKVCDNCNIKMQNYIRAQDSDADIDIVTEVVSFCSNLLDSMLKSSLFAGNQSLILESMNAIADFCTGPCIENQAIVGKDVKLFLGINSIFKLKYDRKFGKAEVKSASSSTPAKSPKLSVVGFSPIIKAKKEKKPDEFVELRATTLHLLQVLLEGNASADTLGTFRTFLKTDNLVAYATDVYLNVIEGNKEAIEMGDFASNPNREIVEYAMDVSLFLIQYQGLSRIPMDVIIKRDDDIRAFKEFYLLYNGYVEIYKPMGGSTDLEDLNNLWGVSFRIPFKCKLLTEESASALIVDVSHASKQEKLTEFMDQVKPLEAEMDHQMRLRHRKWLYYLTKYWQTYKDISLVLVILINTYLLMYFDTVRGLQVDNHFEVAVVVGCGGLQTFLYLLGYICNVKQRYPLILNAYCEETSNEIEMDQFYELKDHDSQKFKHIEEEAKKEEEGKDVCWVMPVLIYASTWITIVYIAVSVLVMIFPLFAPSLLLVLAERKAEIQNILKAVTLNIKQLLLSACLGVILLYVFAVFSFVFFPDYYKKESGITCETMWECLLTTINIGLRGGLADAMGSSKEDSYWGRFAYDLLFHIAILILMLNVIFGIIIDTFGKLRDERSALYDDIDNVCYVCGTSRNKIELGGKGWSYHFQVEHSPFAYLAYLVRLRSIKEDELNGIESYVAKLFKEKDSSFFPSTSRHLVQALKSE